MTSARAFVPLAGFLAASALAACGEPLGGDHPALATASGSPVGRVAPVPVDPASPDAGSPAEAGTPAEAGVPDPQAGTYEAMCRHYCETLEQTLVYACLASASGDAAVCAERFQGTTAQCHDLRCVPRRVEASLCLQQCDSLASSYAGVCGTAGVGPESVCPSPAAAHDDACRAGCALATS
jgi:hypothetical protein